MPIILTLTLVNKSTFTIEIPDGSTTIGEIKKIIKETSTNNDESCRLLYDGKILNDDQTYESCNFKEKYVLVYLPIKKKVVEAIPKVEVKEEQIVVVDHVVNGDVASPRASPRESPDASEDNEDDENPNMWGNNPDDGQPNIQNIDELMNNPEALMNALGIQPDENGNIPEIANQLLGQMNNFYNQIHNLANMYEEDIYDAAVPNLDGGDMIGGNNNMIGGMNFMLNQNIRELINLLPQKYPHLNFTPDDFDVIENIYNMTNASLTNIVDYYFAFEKNQDSTVSALLG